jgi:hypothetical protein
MITADAERWAPIPGYEGLYEVSSFGRVRSLDRVVPHGLHGFARIRGVMRKTFPDHHGYPRVVLTRSGRAKTHKVHRLVLEAFVGTCPSGLEACHADDDSSNPALANLRWDTRRNNQLDKVANGNHPQARKTHCPRNHRLIEPNLIPGQLRRGWRNCRACYCEFKLAHKWGRPFDPDGADRKYRELMEIA